MKSIELEFQENGVAKIIELFNTILEQSGYNLNQFVKGDSLAVPNEVPEPFLDSLKKFVNISPDVIRSIENKEDFWGIFEKLEDYENNDKFIKWMQRYIDSVIRPFEEAKFIRDMSNETFQKITKYCFENLIIKDIGKKRIDRTMGDLKQLYVLRKIMFTFIEMVLVENFSRENAFDKMDRIFGIKESCCKLWWELIEDNEEKLWRIMMMKQSKRIENKLDNLLELMDE